jgi:hypothetical protein
MKLKEAVSNPQVSLETAMLMVFDSHIEALFRLLDEWEAAGRIGKTADQAASATDVAIHLADARKAARRMF